MLPPSFVCIKMSFESTPPVVNRKRKFKLRCLAYISKNIRSHDTWHEIFYIYLYEWDKSSKLRQKEVEVTEYVSCISPKNNNLELHYCAKHPEGIVSTGDCLHTY